MENTVGKIAKPEFIKQTSKLEAVTSYIQSFSSYISNKTFQQNNNVSILNPEDINSLIVFSKFNWVNWTFSSSEVIQNGKTEKDKESLCLFLGYKKGFQIWNISDPEKIYEVCSVYENVDEVKAIEIIPANSKNPLLDNECPFLALLNVKTIENEDKKLFTKSEILIYSLKTHTIIKTISFNDNVEILKFKTNAMALIVSLSNNQLQIISLENFETAIVLTDVAPSLYDDHPAIFDVGSRYLAYATTTGPDTPEKSNKIQMSVMAEKVAKEVLSSVKVLGNIGLQAVKAAKNSYYQNTSGNNNNNNNNNNNSNNTNHNGSGGSSTTSPVTATIENGNIIIHEESGKSNELNYQFPVGMIKIFDIQKLLHTKDINNIVPLAHFQAQHHYIEYIQFNESGSLLITSSCEGFTLNIWKLENHFDKKPSSLTCLYKLKRGKTSARIESVTFSTDSRWISVLSNHGTVHLYYIDPFGIEEMYKRMEIMKQYNDIPISNVNNSNFKNIRSKSINEMVNFNLISTPLPNNNTNNNNKTSPLTSPTTADSSSPPNNSLSNKLFPTTQNPYDSGIINTYSSSALNINSKGNSNYSLGGHSYHSMNSINDNDWSNINNSSFKSNSYSSSYRNSSYMNFVHPNSLNSNGNTSINNNGNNGNNTGNNNNNNNNNGSNNIGKPIQVYAISRIKYKKCSFYYVNSNEASYALTMMNLNTKLNGINTNSTSNNNNNNIMNNGNGNDTLINNYNNTQLSTMNNSSNLNFGIISSSSINTTNDNNNNNNLSMNGSGNSKDNSNNNGNNNGSINVSEWIHPVFYSPSSSGKFLNKVILSSEKREPNEKQKILIFRITEDHRQGQLELYKFFGSDVNTSGNGGIIGGGGGGDDSSFTSSISHLETSPSSSTSALNNNISPLRRKSFSYSPSNSISLTSLCNPGDDILHSKLKIQKVIQWDLNRKKNWPPVKSIIKIIISNTTNKLLIPSKTNSNPTNSNTIQSSTTTKVLSNNLNNNNSNNNNNISTSTTTKSSITNNLQDVSFKPNSTSLLNSSSNNNTKNNNYNNDYNSLYLNNNSTSNINNNNNSNSSNNNSNSSSNNGRRRSKGNNKKGNSLKESSSSGISNGTSPPTTSNMSSFQSQLLNNKKLMKEKSRQNQIPIQTPTPTSTINMNMNMNNNNNINNNIEKVSSTIKTTTTINMDNKSTTSSITNPSITTTSTTNTQINQQKLLSPDSIKQLAFRNKKWMENIEISPYDMYHTGPPLWLYSQFVFQVFINREEGKRDKVQLDNSNNTNNTNNNNSTSNNNKENLNSNVDIYGNPVFDSYFSNCYPDYDEFPKTKSISIFKRKPKPSSDYGIIPIVNADSDLLQESLYSAINEDQIDYGNFQIQKSYTELMKQELSFDDALHIYSSTSVITTNDKNSNSNSNSNNDGDNIYLQNSVASQNQNQNQKIINSNLKNYDNHININGTSSNSTTTTNNNNNTNNKGDENDKNFNFKKENVEEVTLSTVKTKTISYDEEGNEFEELSDEENENQHHILGLESNPNNDLQFIEENVIQEEDQEDQDKVIISKRNEQKSKNAYVSTTTTITHLYITPDPPEDVIKSKKN
ncbi:hypothetical protein BCR32DRAFT_297195 [Anaeromyces robustus]|uniref:BCAS3 WD40 domain-containing protein n=1 Tax=Anaeromyces robustus TaxID=1754192 RepID=A0A1Y1WIV6_9FUNG|nr:hypothetical protein BCR32DRAFT_297195 [Anaeromyces robustus]|eukprot:ORX73412.1 hypothetical protein BCR32DRAFT_297195 [Anaeromyces robustus]